MRACLRLHHLNLGGVAGARARRRGRALTGHELVEWGALCAVCARNAPALREGWGLRDVIAALKATDAEVPRSQTRSRSHCQCRSSVKVGYRRITRRREDMRADWQQQQQDGPQGGRAETRASEERAPGHG